jgi:phage terminase large subunit
MEIDFEVHESHIPLWENTSWRYAFLMGGRGNGRSGTASRYAVSRLLGKEYTRGAIMRATREDIRASCWSEIIDRIKDKEIEKQFHITDNDMFVGRGKNSLRAHGFRASSGSLTARLKSLAGYNFIWNEEGEETGEQEFRTLDDSLRTVQGRIQIIFTLNTPPKNHWIIQNFFDLTPHPEAPGFFIPTLKPEHANDAIYIGGTYRENLPNLDHLTVRRYEKYRDTNPAYYWQMIEGLSPETVRGRIYSGWQLIDQVPPEARLVHFGEDFGWYPDPAALVAVYYWNGSYIIDELAYGTELTNEFLANQMKQVGRVPAAADSADPRSIDEQSRYGVSVHPIEKGKDSVRQGIQLVSQKKVFVTRRSQNVWQSYENYAWDEDKDGNPKGIPAHQWSHAMDAVRYALTMLHGRRLDPVIPTAPRRRSNVAL